MRLVPYSHIDQGMSRYPPTPLYHEQYNYDNCLIAKQLTWKEYIYKYIPSPNLHALLIIIRLCCSRLLFKQHLAFFIQ